ncbi:MAG: hypothetical protein PHS77_00530 [Gallionellaceae bacterium]|nr:hypothetical protein [Gallionellaceae bacterium]
MSRLPAAVVTLCIALAPALAPAAEAERTPTALPASPQAWLAQMLDARRNGAAFKDPAVFVEWLDAVTEPRFMTAMAATALDPATYPKALANAVDPASVRNWAAFTDPQLYLRWLFASLQPSFHQAIASRLSDPAKLRRWMETMAATQAADGTARQAADAGWLTLPDAAGPRQRY